MSILFLKNSILFLLFTTSIFSQHEKFIHGKLLDSQTGEAVIFATVRIKGKAVGVVTNQDGGFKIPVRFKEYGDILKISSMGYENKEISMFSLSLNDLNIIQLDQGLFKLNEAIVTAKKKKLLSARRIVRKAIKAIPNNFPMASFSTIGYYRDYQLSEKQYVNLNEAILEVFDQGFDELDQETTKVKLYHYRGNTDFKRDEAAQQPYNYHTNQKTIDKAFLFNYGGNEFTILRVHDAIRNYQVDTYSFVHRLDTDLLTNHSFSKVSDMYLEDEVLYTIKFTKSFPDYIAYGILYISKRDFAIHKMEYALYDNIRQAQNRILNKHGNTKQLIFRVITEYKRQNGKLFLNYISFHNSFQLRDDPKFLLNYITVDQPRRCFYLTFNEEPDVGNALFKNNYKVTFKGKKLSIARVEVKKKSVLLYPDLDTNKAEAMFNEIALASKTTTVDDKLFSIKIKNLKDVKGNYFNEGIIKEYDQFREFFTQQIKPNTSVPIDNLYMIKGKPIFKDQPIVAPYNLDKYWMNTPLKIIDK